MLEVNVAILVLLKRGVERMHDTTKTTSDGRPFGGGLYTRSLCRPQARSRVRRRAGHVRHVMSLPHYTYNIQMSCLFGGAKRKRSTVGRSGATSKYVLFDLRFAV